MELEQITQELCMIQTETDFPAIKYFWDTYEELESCKLLRGAKYDKCMNSKYKKCMELTYMGLAEYTMDKNKGD